LSGRTGFGSKRRSFHVDFLRPESPGFRYRRAAKFHLPRALRRMAGAMSALKSCHFDIASGMLRYVNYLLFGKSTAIIFCAAFCGTPAPSRGADDAAERYYWISPK
jgi:hypothetical protein